MKFSAHSPGSLSKFFTLALALFTLTALAAWPAVWSQAEIVPPSSLSLQSVGKPESNGMRLHTFTLTERLQYRGAFRHSPEMIKEANPAHFAISGIETGEKSDRLHLRIDPLRHSSAGAPSPAGQERTLIVFCTRTPDCSGYAQLLSRESGLQLHMDTADLEKRTQLVAFDHELGVLSEDEGDIIPLPTFALRFGSFFLRSTNHIVDKDTGEILAGHNSPREATRDPRLRKVDFERLEFDTSDPSRLLLRSPFYSSNPFSIIRFRSGEDARRAKRAFEELRGSRLFLVFDSPEHHYVVHARQVRIWDRRAENFVLLEDWLGLEGPAWKQWLRTLREKL
jgi:hypothetical protein